MKVMRRYSNGVGFTFVEIIVVVMILALAALIAIPMIGGTAGTKIRAAANIVASDLEYAKSMAITSQKNYKVVFNSSTDSYQIEDENGVINHPVKKGFSYSVNFQTDSALSGVDIVSANFGGDEIIVFDYLGSPDSAGSITLSSGSATSTVTVAAVTGYISTDDN